MAFGDFATSQDDFNRANTGPPPSASWTTMLNGHKVVTNACAVNTAAAQCISFWNAATFGADVEAYATISTAASGGQPEVYARMTTLSSGTTDGYCVRFVKTSGANNDKMRIFRIDNGAFTQLGADVSTSVDYASGDKIGIEVVGTTITAYHFTGGAWVNRGSRTDSTYSAAGYVGVGSVDDVLDNFFAGVIRIYRNQIRSSSQAVKRANL
jgi:hypothetical protein